MAPWCVTGIVQGAAALDSATNIYRPHSDHGHVSVLNVQQPNGPWPANGDNTREGYKIGYGVTSSCPNCARGQFEAYHQTETYIPGQRTNTSWMIPAYGAVALREHDGELMSQVNIDSYHLGWYGHCTFAVNNLQLTAFGHRYGCYALCSFIGFSHCVHYCFVTGAQHAGPTALRAHSTAQLLCTSVGRKSCCRQYGTTALRR